MTNRRSRRSNKKKHDVPLTEDMLNELNKNSMGGYGGHRGHPGDMGGHGGHHGPPGGGHGGGMGAYDNYGQDPDEVYDLDDVWNNDRYNFGQNRYKVCFERIATICSLFWLLNSCLVSTNIRYNFSVSPT